MNAIFERRESGVRRYCRTYPISVKSAVGSEIFCSDGKRYIDFLMGSGSLNYGHNDPDMKAALIAAMETNAPAMGLDFYTPYKAEFLSSFEERILEPKHLDYVVQFVGPTGTNGVEAALKLARKTTKRQSVLAFTNAFHGCSLGSIAVTGNYQTRMSSEALLSHVHRAPFDGYSGKIGDGLDLIRKLLHDPSSGYSDIGAILFEPIQGEGGFNAASKMWALGIEQLAREIGALLIVDEIQSGCGRSGDFFAFEALGIKPDMVVLAKSISGFGLPMAVVLIDRAYDQWLPGEHSGTFRGNTHAFITGAVALEKYWSDAEFQEGVKVRANYIDARLNHISEHYGFLQKGRGLMQGLDLKDGTLAARVQRALFDHGMILETCGPHGNVLKLLPALNIDIGLLEEGLSTIETCISKFAFERA